MENTTQITDEIIREKVLVDYSTKTRYMVDNNINQSDINNFIALLNYCFLTKNEFFIPTFNHKMIPQVYRMYNRMKTNIIQKDINDLFQLLSEKDLKMLRFLTNNYVTNFNRLQSEQNIITNYVSKESMGRMLKTIDFRLSFIRQSIM